VTRNVIRPVTQCHNCSLCLRNLKLLFYQLFLTFCSHSIANLECLRPRLVSQHTGNLNDTGKTIDMLACFCATVDCRCCDLTYTPSGPLNDQFFLTKTGSFLFVIF